MNSPRDLLLYVDDEEQALKYFSMMFSKDYEVVTAASADLAWPLVEQYADRLALVISDQRMPGRSGVDLLTAVKERCPRAVRLLTTAFSDLDSAISAVNRGAIYAYVTKPWKVDELRVVVRQALQLHHVQSERDALLAEKLTVFQDLLLADRSRALGMALSGYAGQVRRPLAAAAAWLRDRQGVFAIADVAGGDHRDLWPSVLAQSRSIAALAGELGVWLSRQRGSESSTDVAAVLATAAGTPGITVSSRTATTQAVDVQLLGAGFKELLRLVRHSAGSGATITVNSAKGSPILALQVAGAAESGLDPDRAGLAGYLAIHHHGGSVSVPSWKASDKRLVVTLGGSEDDGLESFLAVLSSLER